ncbi:MAG: hypothetical protein AAFP02_08460 [Bacteroidota bacterium]
MKVYIDKSTYKLMLGCKTSCGQAERLASKPDLAFLHEDLWLQDTAVVERVVKLHGAWEVFLLFVHYQNPLLFIKRYIKKHFSAKKACMEAQYMRRLAAKDQRGTLHIHPHNLHICPN